MEKVCSRAFIVDHPSAAPLLTGMLADQGAGGGERIVLADQANRVVASAGGDQRYVAGDVHIGRAKLHAGDGLLNGAYAWRCCGDPLDKLPSDGFAGGSHFGAGHYG